MDFNHTRHTLAITIVSLLLLGVSCNSPADEPTPSEPALPSSDGPSATEVIDEVKQPVTAPTMNAEENTAERQSVPTGPVGILPDERIKNKQVVLNTNKGQIVFDLFADEAPKTVSNFVALAESGYFDGLTFHRVVPGFVIQGGDPSGNGTGGPGYRFEDEPVTRDYLAGTVAMANAGPDTNGSQFFICLEDQPGLPKNYTIFGQVKAGLEVVRAIAIGDTMDEVRIEPLQ